MAQMASHRVLQDGSKSLKLHDSGVARVGKDVLEHGVRQACASLLRQALEKGENPMLYRHGQAAEPSLPRLMDFTVFASASVSFDPSKPSNLAACGQYQSPVTA